VPVVDVVRESFLLGGAANVANNIIALGGKVTVAGVIGKDRAGDVVRELMTDCNISTDGIIEDSRPTTVKSRVIAHNQQVVRFDREDRRKLEGKGLVFFLEYIKKALPYFDAVIISDYMKGVVSASLVKSVVKYAKQKKTFVAVDPKVGHFHLYKNVSLITPNLSEASQGSGIEIKDEKSLLKAGKTLLSRLSCTSVLITRGEEGMSLFERNVKAVKVTHIPTVAKKGFRCHRSRRYGHCCFYPCVRGRAHHCRTPQSFPTTLAGIVVGEIGTAVATPEAILQSLTAHTV